MEFLEYEFIQRALIVGISCAIISGFLGNFLVASRNTITAEMISHCALAGVGLGFLVNLSPNLFATLFSIATTFLLFLLTRNNKKINEGIAVTLLSGGVALGLLFIHLAKDNPVAFHSFLFGSILTITPMETIFFLIMSAIFLIIIFVFWNRFMAMIFDYPFFRTKSSSFVFELLFMLMIGCFVSLSLKIIGSLLVSSLLVIPSITCQSFARHFRESVFWSVILNVMAIIIGISSSYYLDIPTSSGIVLSLVTFYIISNLTKKLV